MLILLAAMTVSSFFMGLPTCLRHSVASVYTCARESDTNDVSGQHGGIAKSDNEPAQTILVQSFSNLGAIKGGSRMILKTSGQTDETRSRGDSGSLSPGYDQNDA